MTGIASAIASLSAVQTIANGLLAARDQALVLSLKTELHQKVHELQQSLFAAEIEKQDLLNRNRELEQANLELHQRISTLEKHELIELTGGVCVLAAKPDDGKAHRPPYFCSACQQDGKKSLLHFEPPEFGDSSFHSYLRCQIEPRHSIAMSGATKPKDLGFAG